MDCIKAEIASRAERESRINTTYQITKKERIPGVRYGGGFKKWNLYITPDNIPIASFKTRKEAVNYYNEIYSTPQPKDKT